MKTPQQELGDELRDYLYRTVADEPSGKVRWVMNREWLKEVFACAEYRGMWDPPRGRPHLLGIPVEVRQDGGVPHLEPAP